MNIAPEEVEIQGLWFQSEGRWLSNDACRRVQALVKDALQEIAFAARGHERLYRDPGDGRFWELSYPFGAGQPAGPPTLRQVRLEDVRERYALP